MYTFAVAQLSTTGRVRFQIDRNDTRAFKDSHSFPRGFVGLPSSPEWRSSWRDVRVATKSWSDKSGLTLDSKILH